MSEAWQLGSRYRLEQRVGAGAMGQVWAGHDVDGYPLAFKLLRPEFADQPGVVARFLQERNLLVSLRSPHVIRVHDLVVEGPRLAIVMDYVPGPSLRGLLQQRGNLTPAEVTSLGARMARGLAAVHGAGILHRDFKPENVLLADSEHGPQPKIADFGIASLAVTSSGHVGTAGVIGTPQYLAPELGDGQPSGRAGDLYALGVTLYEMACGSVPFTAEAPLALLRLHADYAPGRPAGIPDELWHLIAALLAKNPGERPDDAAQVAEALEQMTPRLAGFPAGPPLRTPPPPHRLDAPGPSADGRPDRRSYLVAAAIVVTLLAAALLAWLLFAGDDEASGARQSMVTGTTSVTAPASTPALAPPSR